jgi:DNA-binding SARP family transcriptional activator/TolB-like protein
MIEIRTLGGTSVSVNREPLTGEAVWPKSLALIVYMAIEPGPDRREEILGVLWPDRDEKRARRALNQLLYTLRKASPELDLESVSDALDFGKEVWLDVEEFERRLEVGDLRGAVELYRGPFLDDLSVGEPEFDHWADRQRAELRRKFRKAALELANRAKGAGDLDEAVGYCRRLVEADALDDEAQHLLIECQYLRGDRLAALRQYEKYRDVLEHELEVEPLDHTRELVARIKAEKAPAEPAAEAGLEEMGEPAPDEPSAPVAVAAMPDVETEEGTEKSRISFGRWVLAVLGVVAVVVVAVIVLWPEEAEQEPTATATSSQVTGVGRVAVLPFDLHGAGLEDQDLPASVAQLLTLNLAEGGGLETVDHRSVLRAWETTAFDATAAASPAVLDSLANDLGASALLLGDIHASGAEVRIVADVLAAHSNTLLARADVRGHRDSLFSLLDRLAAQLADELTAASDTTSQD